MSFKNVTAYAFEVDVDKLHDYIKADPDSYLRNDFNRIVTHGFATPDDWDKFLEDCDLKRLIYAIGDDDISYVGAGIRKHVTTDKDAFSFVFVTTNAMYSEHGIRKVALDQYVKIQDDTKNKLIAKLADKFGMEDSLGFYNLVGVE